MRPQENMSAERITTNYPAVEHLTSFWEAVFCFQELKESEGKHVASTLMTDCIDISGAIQNEPYNNPQFMRRTSTLQENAFNSLWAFLNDPALLDKSDAFEAIWITAGV